MMYERELMAIMHQYGVYNEAEAVSGCISKFAKHKRKKGDVKALVISAVQALRRHMARYVIPQTPSVIPFAKHRRKKGNVKPLFISAVQALRRHMAR